MVTASRRTPRGWPFFAPSRDEAIAAALDLAGVGPGDWFVDLGCGEGNVLLAAGHRGAFVSGVECDASLAETAREELAHADLAGDVVVGDLFYPSTYGCGNAEAGPTPDVLFSYLSPASLQRLVPVLRNLSRSRLVTVDFDVPGLVPDATDGAARLYHLPGQARAASPDGIGWPTAGSLCIMPPDVNSLTCLEVIHRGGPVDVALRGNIARHATVALGADTATRGQPVAVDIRWRERPEGTLAQGVLEVEGARPHPVTVLFAQEDQGQWDLSPDGCADLDARLRRRNLPRPTTAQELLDVLL